MPGAGTEARSASEGAFKTNTDQIPRLPAREGTEADYAVCALWPSLKCISYAGKVQMRGRNKGLIRLRVGWTDDTTDFPYHTPCSGAGVASGLLMRITIPLRRTREVGICPLPEHSMMEILGRVSVRSQKVFQMHASGINFGFECVNSI